MKQEEKIAMRSIKRLSNGISREMCAAFGSGMFSGAQGRTLHFLLAEHTKSDVFQKDIEAEFGLQTADGYRALKGAGAAGTDPQGTGFVRCKKKKIVVTEKALQYKECVLKGLGELNQKLTAGISEEEMQVFFSCEQTRC